MATVVRMHLNGSTYTLGAGITALNDPMVVALQAALGQMTSPFPSAPGINPMPDGGFAAPIIAAGAAATLIFYPDHIWAWSFFLEDGGSTIGGSLSTTVAAGLS